MFQVITENNQFGTTLTSALNKSMSRNGKRNTAPERNLRQVLRSQGVQYRVEARPEAALPRRADIVIPKYRVAIFVHGCFWHGCIEHYMPPKSNSAYWAGKVWDVMRRDMQTADALRELGWTVVVAWEHEDPHQVWLRKVRPHVKAGSSQKSVLT